MEHPSPIDLGLVVQDKAGWPQPQDGGVRTGREVRAPLSPFRSIPVLGMGMGSFKWDVRLG